MENKSKHISVKLVIYFIAMILGVIAVCLPHWTQQIKAQPDSCMPVDRVTNSGLWWRLDYFQIEEKNETAWNISKGHNKTVAGLMCCGLSVLFLYWIIILGYLCYCSNEKDKRILLWSCWLGILAAVFLGSAVLDFYVAVKKDNETLSSGFWLAVFSYFLAFITGTFDIIISCCKYRTIE